MSTKEIPTSVPTTQENSKPCRKPFHARRVGKTGGRLKGNGDGSFNTNALVLPVPPYKDQSFYAPLAVTTGDFDGDGNPDFAVLVQVLGNALTNDIITVAYVYYGNGDGTFSAPLVAGGFTEFYDTINSADLNKDGRSDLILQISSTAVSRSVGPGSSVGVVLSAQGRLFGPETVYSTGPTTDTFVADVNRDGYPNLLISNSSFYHSGSYSTAASNSVTELLNLGAPASSTLVATSTNLSASSRSFAAGTSITFTATVNSAASSSSTPSGTVRFADQTGVAKSVALIPSSNDSATATFTTSMIGIGADIMSATYSGDGTFAPSSSTVPLTVAGLPDTITFTATPSTVSLNSTVTFNVTVSNPAGSTASIPTGYIEFRDGSTIIGGQVSLSNGSTPFSNAVLSTTGSHTLSAWYSGDLTHVSNTATQIETVLITPSVWISTPSSVTTAQVLSAAITVSGGTGNPTPTGSVTLTASTTPSGSGYTSSVATLSNGSAKIDIPAGTLATGTYWLTPTYTPDTASSSIYLSSSTIGDYVSVTIPPPAFTINGTAVTVAPGATTGNSSTITVTPSGGFSGSVTLSASITSSPNGAQYPPTLSFGSTSPVSISGTSAGTATLTVLTTPSTTGALIFPFHDGVPWRTSSGTALACILLIGIRPMRRKWRSMIGMLLLLVTLTGGVLACSGGGGGAGGGKGGTTIPGTTVGTYVVTIAGTSGATSATNTVTLIVQ